MLFDSQSLPDSKIGPLFAQAYEVLAAESNVREVRAHVTICNNTHGQFDDLKDLFAIGGRPKDTNYFFMGPH